MARKLRIQYAGALYHVINRGNYRRDLFQISGEAESFLATLNEAQQRMGWRVHAFVLMRNHYHFALETPEPTLVDGMHWLQSTWGNRFNRYRNESGHLFQGRYRAILLQDENALGRVVDYIHLNPVRAKIVEPSLVANYRWSSLGSLLKAGGWVDDDGWRATGEFGPDPEDRIAYRDRLIKIGQNEASWKEQGLVGLSEGWALGTAAWKKALAEEWGRKALEPGFERAEIQEIREGAWEKCLKDALSIAGRGASELYVRPYKQDWKIAVAKRVKDQTGASTTWLAERMNLGRPASLRSYLSRFGSTCKANNT